MTSKVFHFTFGCLLLAATIGRAEAPYLANGVKVGEVDTDSAIVWVRLTQNAGADFERLPIFTLGLEEGGKDEGAMPADVLPGAEGEARVLWWPVAEEGKSKLSTGWIAVSPGRDYIHQFAIAGLRSHTRYAYSVQARKTGQDLVSQEVSGHFQTAPEADQAPPVRFIVTTCQAIRSIDSGREGHLTYEQMLEFEPHFLVHTGDIVYYDKAPLAKSVPRARAKWNRDFLSQLPDTYVICGDRHWQYCSQDPKTGLLEMGCGPINDQHNYGGNPGKIPEYHRYFSGKGGFLGITVENGEAKAEWFGTDYRSIKPTVRYTQILGR